MSQGNLLRAYNVVACRACGFCFASNIPDQAAFDHYYEEMSKYETADRVGAESSYDVAKFERTAALVEQVCPDKKATVLEIGCATGGLLAALKKKGYANISGFDPSVKCAEVARRLHGVNATQATLDSFNGSKAGFDVVILLGVLEHIRDLTTSCQK